MKKLPLYQIILNDIKKDILAGNYQVNQQIPTELELSKQYHVSRITSKRALAELENEDLIYRLRGKGSFVKQRIRKTKPTKEQDILFIMPFPNDVGFGNYTQGIFESLEDRDYRLVIQSHETSQIGTLKTIIDQYAGVIFYPVNHESDLEFLYSLHLHQVPTVVLDKKYEGIDFSTVVSDNSEGGFLATDFLLKKGLSEIAFVSSHPIMEISTIRERYLGFLKSLHGFEKAEKYLFENKNEMEFERFIQDVVNQVLEKKINGLVAENDIVAIALINQLKKQKVNIPKELSIVGFDNIQASELIEPSLTTVAQDFKKMGYLACQKLIEEIEQPHSEVETIVVEVELIERETTN